MIRYKKNIKSPGKVPRMKREVIMRAVITHPVKFPNFSIHLGNRYSVDLFRCDIKLSIFITSKNILNIKLLYYLIL